LLNQVCIDLVNRAQVKDGKQTNATLHLKTLEGVLKASWHSVVRTPKYQDQICPCSF
jgi:hypothetical protein